MLLASARRSISDPRGLDDILVHIFKRNETMKPFKTMMIAACGALALTACSDGGSGAGTRDAIRIVGSSTVFPFTKKVAEIFAREHPEFKAPLIESTGTGGGMKLFCGGVGADTPDMTGASRRMKKSEFDDCQANGVSEIVEVQVGLDGLAFASAKDGVKIPLTTKAVYEALAARPYGKEQTAKLWSDIDPSYPAEPILVYGPPSTSGTRDALKELVLEKGCQSDPAMKALKDSDKDQFKQICTEVRSDGAYRDQGENDNLIVQKLVTNPKAIGVFGYSYLEENLDKLQGLTLGGVEPTYDNISSFAYPGARPLFVYVKKAHVGVIPGIPEFLQTYAENWDKGGPLAKIGLIASPPETMEKSAKTVRELTVLDGSELK